MFIVIKQTLIELIHTPIVTTRTFIALPPINIRISKITLVIIPIDPRPGLWNSVADTGAGYYSSWAPPTCVGGSRWSQPGVLIEPCPVNTVHRRVPCSSRRVSMLIALADDVSHLQCVPRQAPDPSKQNRTLFPPITIDT